MRDGDYSLVAEPDYELSKANMFQEAWIPKIRFGGYRNFQMFNLANDPQQTNDIAAKNPKLLKELKAKQLNINQSIMREAHDWTAD